VRVVFLNPSGELGGAETALLEMLAALREARPAWALKLIASADGPLVERAAASGVESLALKFPLSLARLGEWGRRGSVGARLQFGAAVGAASAPTLRYASRLRHHLNEFNPHIVHTNGLKMHLLGAWCRPAGSKLVWHLHDYPSLRPLTAKLLRAQSGRCDEAIANSDSVANDTRALLGAKVPVRTVHNSVDLDRFRPDGPALDLDALAKLPPFAAGGVRVGLVGTFARWKGHDVFLRALSQMNADAGVRGYIIGEPIYETAGSQFSMRELRELASAHGLGGAVGFTGRTHDVPAALRALDIVVHASVEPEPFGLVIAEAMACGRPVIVSSAGGAAEIAQAGALFHKPGDAADLAARLSELARDPARRASLGAAGREAALRLFSRRRLSETLVPLYESLASAG
jgi:glycosyltransferase involved in cell wall biosynthesis